MMSSAEVVAVVAAEHGVTVDEILSPSRYRHIVAARREVCTRLRAQGWSYPAIGRALGRDHATVMYLVKGMKVRKAVAA